METEQLETSQPSCETSDTCSETGSSSHPPPRKAARRCLTSLAGTDTPRPQRLVGSLCFQESALDADRAVQSCCMHSG